MLIPSGFAGQIPFLSLGSDVGRRTEVHAGRSARSGAFVVEDVDVEGATHRRLVFLDNQMLVQSEAKLRQVKRKNKVRCTVDFGHISTYHSFMCVCACIARDARRDVTRAAVLGLGGGGLCMFLRKCWADVKITAVDIDPVMLEIARDHFDLKPDDNLHVEIKDGLDYLKDEATKGSKLDTLMYDMDNKDRTLGLSCPPAQFLQDDVLSHVTTLLSDNGHFILNLVCRDANLQSAIITSLKRHFKHLVSIKLYEELNEIIFATNSEKPYSKEDLETAAKSLNGTARQRNLVDIRCVDLKDFLQSVTVLS